MQMMPPILEQSEVMSVWCCFTALSEVSHPSVHLSVRDICGPWSYSFEFLKIIKRSALLCKKKSTDQL